MTDAIQVVTTTSNKEEAEKIAEALVGQRLAACVQIGGPITSIYRWQDNIERGEEWLCTIKTRNSHFAAVEAAIRQLHSYDEPEILATPIVAGSRGYLDWLARELVDLSGSQIA